MARAHVRLLLVALTLTALLAAGCTRDESSDTTTPAVAAAALSADEWRTQADAICRDARDRIEAARPGSEAEFAESFEKAIEITQESAARLEALNPPAEFEETQREVVSLLEEQMGTSREISGRIAKGENIAKVVQEYQQELLRVDDEGDALARKVGLEVCGSDDGG